MQMFGGHFFTFFSFFGKKIPPARRRADGGFFRRVSSRLCERRGGVRAPRRGVGARGRRTESAPRGGFGFAVSVGLATAVAACVRPSHYKIVYIQKGAVSARGGGDSCGGGTEAGGRLSASAARGRRVLVCAVARSDDGVRSQTKKAAQSLGHFRSALRRDMQTYSAAAG